MLSKSVKSARKATFNNLLFTTLILVVATVASTAEMTEAQPSRNQLADRLERAYADRIGRIDAIEITSVTDGAIFGSIETRTRYEKVERDGRTMLIESGGDGELEGVYQGIADDLLPEMVRHSASITEESLGGRGVYRIEVDDEGYLAELQTSQMLEENMDGEFLMDAATLYIDRSDLLLRQMSFSQNGQGGQAMTIHFEMDEYQTYSGFPVPHLMRFTIEGLDSLVSDEDMAEIRRSMEEMEAQLASMPQAQREMIERQLLPQMERLEAMMSEGDQGDLGTMEVRVTDVQVQ